MRESALSSAFGFNVMAVVGLAVCRHVTGPPRAYDKPLYEQMCSALFEHIYESCPESEVGLYSKAE